MHVLSSITFFLLVFLGNVVWLEDRMPTKALLDLTRPIRELRHITSAVNDELNNEHGALNENQNDDHMDQDDVGANSYLKNCICYFVTCYMIVGISIRRLCQLCGLRVAPRYVAKSD